MFMNALYGNVDHNDRLHFVMLKWSPKSPGQKLQ